jgi:hypothetical protein
METSSSSSTLVPPEKSHVAVPPWRSSRSKPKLARPARPLRVGVYSDGWISRRCCIEASGRAAESCASTSNPLRPSLANSYSSKSAPLFMLSHIHPNAPSSHHCTDVILLKRCHLVAMEKSGDFPKFTPCVLNISAAARESRLGATMGLVIARRS